MASLPIPLARAAMHFLSSYPPTFIYSSLHLPLPRPDHFLADDGLLEGFVYGFAIVGGFLLRLVVCWPLFL
jgi:hypothetical protein